MSYRVRIESFEGPFDLLLYLVSRQKVAIGSISISAIADQYLEEVAHLERLDLDLASDFLLVAATLLEIKAQSLLPQEKREDADAQDEEEISPSEARDILIGRLIRYKQYKNAAADLGRRLELEECFHEREAGLEPELTDVLPDFLEGIRLENLGMLAAEICAARKTELLDSEHIAAKPIPVEVYVQKIAQRLTVNKRCNFSELIAAHQGEVAYVVVCFLAVLELFKRGRINVVQDTEFGDMILSPRVVSGEDIAENPQDLKDEHA